MRVRRLLFALACGVGWLVAVMGVLRAAPVAQTAPIVRYVTGDCSVITATPCYTSIQAAIQAAAPGDVISVTQGVYYETLLLTKSLVLQGGWNISFTVRDGYAYTTTLDAQRTGPPLRIYGATSPVIEGFVIRGGDGTTSGVEGGGIQLYYATGVAVIRHNVIEDNIGCRTSACFGLGGGISVYSSTAIIEHNTIISNAARLAGAGGRGGGIHIGAASVVTLTDNLVLSNTAVLEPAVGSVEGKGGGIYVEAARVFMDGNRMERNTALYGGGLFVYSSTGVITGNLITANVAITRGGGLYLYRNATPWLEGNTIMSNTVTAGDGGGVCIRGDDGPVTLTRHVIAGNRAVRGGGVAVSFSAAVHLVHNRIVENQADYGGGLLVESSSGTVMDNQIARNVADWGGGVHWGAWSGVLESDRVVEPTAMPGDASFSDSNRDMRLTDNQIYENTAGYGGGLFVRSSSGLMAGNWITGNVAITRGGGLYLYTDASPRLDANRILGNTSTGEAGGVCIRSNNAPVTLTNHLMACNRAARYGGVYVYSSPGVSLINNTLLDSSCRETRTSGLPMSSGAGQEGVALLRESPLYPPAWVTLTNNIIVGHSVGVTVAAGCTATFSHNDFYSNTVDVVGQSFGATDLQLDPLFADDYHLSEASPLIDAGDNSVRVRADIDGDLRPAGRGIDIGADEFPRYYTYLPLVVRHPLLAPQPVQVYETTLMIPTYGYTQAFVYNPADPIYPYPRLDFDRVGPVAPHTYRAVVLENAYVRVMVLPELGGRVYAWIDKTSGRPLAYSNPVIKPVQGWGYRGWWLATGGIEWCLPTEEHGLNEYRPWQYALGSHSVTVSDTESLTGLNVQVTLSLDRDHNYLMIQPRLTNGTASPQTFEFWLNGMLAFSGNQVSHATRFIMPIERVIVHSTGDPHLPGPGMTMAWPIYNGRDVSVQGNLQGWMGVFAWPYAAADFAGAYDASADLGVARVFSHTLTRGLKLFTPRNLPPAIWTDDESNYFELWGGLSPAFGQRVTLAAGAALTWLERWYPVSGLGKGFDYANAHAALRLDDDNGVVRVRIATSSNLANARIKLWHGQQVVQEWVAAVGPGHPLNLAWPQAPTAPLGVQLLDASGNLLAQTGTVGQ